MRVDDDAYELQLTRLPNLFSTLAHALSNGPWKGLYLADEVKRVAGARFIASSRVAFTGGQAGLLIVYYDLMKCSYVTLMGSGCC